MSFLKTLLKGGRVARLVDEQRKLQDEASDCVRSKQYMASRMVIRRAVVERALREELKDD